MRQQNLITVIYFVIVLCCLSMSAFFSFKGLDRSMGTFAALAAASIILFLFAADIMLRRCRLEGRSVLMPLLLFCFGLALSFVSNFTHLYNNAIAPDETLKASRSAYNTYRTNLNDARAAISQSPFFRQQVDLHNTLTNELQQMWRQIENPNPSLRGCGQLCREHSTRIYELLDNAMTELRPPTTRSIPRLRDWFQKFEQEALKTLDDKQQPSSLRSPIGLVKALDEALRTAPLPEANDSQDVAEAYIRSLSTRQSELGRLSNDISGVEPLAFTPLQPEGGRVNEIEYALYNGFVLMPNAGTTFLNAAIALIVDLFPVIFALAFFHPGRGQYNPPPRDLDQGFKTI